VDADGSTTSTITLQAKDANNNNLSVGGLTVTMIRSGSSATLSSVTDNNDGTYTATIKNTTAETVTVTAAFGGTNVTDTATVTFTATAATVGNSTLTASTATVAADGSTTSTITLQAKDANNNNLSVGGLTVTMSTTGSATLSGVTNVGNGTYTATITSTTAETVTVTAAFGGSNVPDTAAVAFTAVVMTVDGVTYSTVKIGIQTWTAENMRHDAVAGNTYTYQGDSAEDVVTYGKLYDWAAAMEGSTMESAQGICALGWHVPSDKDWKDLEDYLGMSTDDQEVSNNWRGTDQGTQLKEVGTSGFEAKLAGFRNTVGNFDGRGVNTHLWSSTAPVGGGAYRRALHSSSAGVHRNALSKASGFSVRCLKD
jgi:uncharacterized protein (TIGR02145 family)